MVESAERIPKAAVRQYVQIQNSRATNMFHASNVRELAKAREATELLDVMDNDDYGTLMENYSELKEFYNIDE